MNIFGNSSIPNVISISNPSVTDHVVTFSDTTGSNVKDSGVTIGSISGGPFLKLDGTTPMAANLNFGGYNISNAQNIIASNKTTPTNDILSQTSNGVLNNIPVYSGTNKILQNSSVLISDLLNNATAASTYVPYTGATTGVNLGTQILTVNNMSDNGGGMRWGSGSTASHSDSLVIGRSSSTATDSLVVGRNSSSAGTYGVILGIGNNGLNNTGGNVAIGTACNVSGDTTPFSGGGGAIAIGFTVDSLNKESIAIGSGLSNSTASSLLIGGTDPMVNWRTSTDNTCDLGVSGAKFKDIYLGGSIIGSVKTSAVNSIVTSSASGVTDSQIPVFDSTSGKILKNSSVLISSLATTSAMTTADNLRLLKAGDTMTGTLAMGSNAVTGTGANTAGSLSLSLGTDASSLTVANLINAGGFASMKKAFIGDDVVIGPAQVISLQNKLTIKGNATTTGGGHIISYNSTDQYPISQMFNESHNSIFINMDCYKDGVGWKSSYAGSNFQIGKFFNKLFFSYASGFAPGSSMSWSDSMAINTSGGLEVYKLLTSSDPTDGSAGPLGSITTLGGISAVKKIYCADTISATKILSSAPLCYWGYQQPIAVVTYTANVPKLIPLASYTENADPSGVFSSNGVGMVTYSGSTTLWFKIDILFNYGPVNASNNLFFWVSKNSNTTLVNSRVVTFPTVAGFSPGYVPQSVGAIFQLSAGDTIQLAGQYSVSGNVSVFDCQMFIVPMC